MKKNENTVFCPVRKGQIGAMDCFDAALVYEGASPLSELPQDMSFSEENKQNCLRCPYHPQ